MRIFQFSNIPCVVPLRYKIKQIQHYLFVIFIMKYFIKNSCDLYPWKRTNIHLLNCVRSSTWIFNDLTNKKRNLKTKSSCLFQHSCVSWKSKRIRRRVVYTIRQQLPLHIYTLYFLNHRVTCMNTKARVILQSFHFIFRFFFPCALKLRERIINKF